MLRLLLALLLTLPLCARADGDLDRVLACMHNNVPTGPRVLSVELGSSDKGGAGRVYKGRLYLRSERAPGGGRIYAMLQITEPAEFAGAAYLMRQGGDAANDGMYMYLPAVKRVRRITGASADGALLGSTFSFNDFKQMEAAYVDAGALLEDPEPIGQRQMHVLSFHPADIEGGVPYTLVRLWVDQITCVPLKTEFYNGMDPSKQMIASSASLRQSGTYWYLSEVQMRDLVSGAGSVLRVTGVAANVAVPDSAFDPANFYLTK